jgi:hypothetical protein
MVGIAKYLRSAQGIGGGWSEHCRSDGAPFLLTVWFFRIFGCIVPVRLTPVPILTWPVVPRDWSVLFPLLPALYSFQPPSPSVFHSFLSTMLYFILVLELSLHFYFSPLRC